ncbi:MAG: hypothetical protein ACO3JL_04340 [Myxococcota bacterium]
MTRVSPDQMRAAAQLLLRTAEQRYVESDGKTLNRKQINDDAAGPKGTIQQQTAAALRDLGPLATAKDLRALSESVFESKSMRTADQDRDGVISNERLIPFRNPTEAGDLPALGRVFWQLAALVQTGAADPKGPIDRPAWLDAQVNTRAD